METIGKLSIEIFGAFGLVVAILIIGIVTMWKFLNKTIKERKESEIEHCKERKELEAEHRKERIEWKETVEKQFQEINRHNIRYEDMQMQQHELLGSIKGILETLK